MSTDDSGCPKTVHECEHAKIVVDQSSDEIVVRVKIKQDADAPRSNVTSITKRRGSRIPPDFTVDETMMQWAREHTPDVDGWYELQKFKNYWESLTGQRANKHEWVKVWQNWMLKAQEDAAKEKRRGASRQGRAAEAAQRKVPEAWV